MEVEILAEPDIPLAGNNMLEELDLDDESAGESVRGHCGTSSPRPLEEAWFFEGPRHL